jgi:hypothetical protein
VEEEAFRFMLLEVEGKGTEVPKSTLSEERYEKKKQRKREHKTINLMVEPMDEVGRE